MRVHFLPSQTRYKQVLVNAAKRQQQVQWTCPSRAQVDDLVLFLLVGNGILASGKVASEPEAEPDDSLFRGRYGSYIKDLRLLANVVPLETLSTKFPDWGFPRYPRSYASIESPLADEVVAFISLCQDEGYTASPLVALTEGKPSQVLITQYRRSRKARELCLSHWGHACAVCGIDFETEYGVESVSCLHVHHLKPMASRKRSYRVNPKRDLRPLCPNCHTVAHRKLPPYSVEELKLLRSKKRGI